MSRGKAEGGRCATYLHEIHSRGRLCHISESASPQHPVNPVNPVQVALLESQESKKNRCGGLTSTRQCGIVLKGRNGRLEGVLGLEKYVLPNKAIWGVGPQRGTDASEFAPQTPPHAGRPGRRALEGLRRLGVCSANSTTARTSVPIRRNLLFRFSSCPLCLRGGLFVAVPRFPILHQPRRRTLRQAQGRRTVARTIARTERQGGQECPPSLTTGPGVGPRQAPRCYSGP